MKIFQKGKRMLALWLSICLMWMFGCFPGLNWMQFCADAEENARWSDGILLYQQAGDLSAWMVMGTASAQYSGELEIPEYYLDWEVVSVADSAFEAQTEITAVTIPATIQSIGARAFYGCSSLGEIHVENTLQSVGEEAFSETAWSTAHAQDEMRILDDTVLISVGETICDLILPETVRVIADGACMGNTNLTSVILTEYTGYVGKKSFFSCENLTDVVLPNGVKSLGDYAFSGSALGRVVVPATIMAIGKGAFSNCTAMEQVVLWDGVLRIGSSAFSGCTSIRQISIPDSVTEMGSSAFRQCSNLQKAVIGSRVTILPDYLFQECTSLSDVTLKGAVTRVGSSAFYKCTALPSVVLPETVTDIGSEAFQSCMSLNSINIPEGIRNIGVNAFFETGFFNHLRTEQEQSGFVIYDGRILLGYYGEDLSVTVPDGVTLIAGAAFAANDDIEEIFLPDSLAISSELW